MNSLSTITGRLRRTCALLVVVILPLSATALAKPGDFEQIVAFGDSLMDSGNAFVFTGQISTPPFEPVPSAAYAIGGHHFSNGDTWVEELGQLLGLQRSTGPAARNAAEFSNYAVGGSRAREHDSGLSAAQQLGWYLSSNNPSADTLYIFGFGGNDVRDALQSGPQNGPLIVGEAVASIVNNLVALCSAGAQHILIPNVANIGTTPFAQGLGEPVISGATFVSASFNSALHYYMSQVVQPSCPDTTFYTLDLFTLSTMIFNSPGGYGFIDTEACLEFYTTGGAICSNPNQHFFWDGIHPTKAGHAIIAAKARDLLATP